MTNKRLVVKELARRQKAAEERALEPKFKIEDYCFDKQIAFIRDPAKFKTAVCSRRAGKTISCAADLMDTALNYDGDVAYITLNRRTAKRIIWRELLKINEKYKIGCKVDNTELTLTLPNGNIIFLSGAKDESEIEKFLGVALRKIYIDECQSFRPYIQRLVEEILEPTLTDYDGSLILIGTPSPIPVGYFYDATHAETGWSHHGWTLHDNPHIRVKSGKDAEQIIAERCERRGVTIMHPSIQREYFGRWVKDTESLVFAFDPARNLYEKAPDPREVEMQYIFGMDIGWNDADAIAVIGYNFHEKTAYIVEEYVKNKQTISEFVAQVQMLKQKYNPIKMVMDAGALGKKIQEEILQRYGLYIEAAEKHRKLEFIELMNDDLRTGKIKTFKGSQFAEDCMLVQWDKMNPTKPKVSDSYHTDIGDAVLYAWRECKHYLSAPAEVRPLPGTDAYMQQFWEQEGEALKAKRDKSRVDDILGSQDDMDSLADDIPDLYSDE